MLTQTRLELFKMTRRLRSYLGFGALVGLSGLLVLGLAFSRAEGFGVNAQGFEILGDFRNAAFISWLMLIFPMSSRFMLPLFASVVSGDMISGEAGEGTLRAILSRPVRREKLIAGKFLASVIYIFVLTLFMGISAYLIGMVFLGQGALVTVDISGGFGEGISYFGSEGDALFRLLMGYMFTALAALSVAAIAFFFSTLISNSLGAIGGAMMIMIILQITQVIPYFNSIQPYLFTHHMETTSLFFAGAIPWVKIAKSAGVLLAYSLGFFGLGLMVFSKKDVLA